MELAARISQCQSNQTHTIEERFRLFESITLPSVKAQTDPNFTFLIVAEKWLPAPYVDRLKKLTSGISQCEIRRYPPRPHRNIMAKASNDWRGPPDTPCLQFCLDDDDAMATRICENHANPYLHR